MRPARGAGKVDRVADVDQVAVDAELVRGDAPEHVFGHQAVLARVRPRRHGQRDAVPVFRNGKVVAVGGEHGGDVRHSLGMAHFFSTTGTEVPDHSPKIRTTMEMAAFLAPATMIGIDWGPLRMGWNSSSGRGGPSSRPPPAAPGGPNRREVTSALPTRRTSPTVRP